MDKIYLLLGKCLQVFQMLEESLALLIYYHECNAVQTDKTTAKKNALRLWEEYDRKTLGAKLDKIIELKVWEHKHDIIVFDYLRQSRNYVVHRFFLENDFDTPEEMQDHIKQLETIFGDTSLLVKALGRMLDDIKADN